MQITWHQFLAGVLALVAVAEASNKASTKSRIRCATRLGFTSTHPVPTKSHVVTVKATATVKVVVTPVKTITPPPVTYTKKKTKTITESTTLDQITDTVSKTKTVTTTDTITKSFTVTVESIVTKTVTNTDTTTVPTSPGFTPASVQTTVKPPARMVRARTADVEARAPKYQQTCTQGADGYPTLYPKLYPTAVVCNGVVKIIQTTTTTSTAKHTKTVTCKPPTKTVTSTSTKTVTTTITPSHAVVTDYYYTTVGTTTDFSTTSTTTTTTTTTETVQAPVATYYAACGPDNSLGTVNGQNIYGFGTNNAVTQIPSTSSYDCCVACLTSPTCGAGVLFSAAYICFLVATPGACDPKVSVLNYFANNAGGPPKDFISTSNCGAIFLSPT